MMELSYDPPLREILRYLGCREESAGRALLEEVDECVRQLGIVVTPRHIYRKYEISQNENGMLRIGGIQIRSRDLSKNLAGCSSCYMIAATLGLGPDRLIKRSQTGRISEAVIYQAAAAAMIEKYLGSLCDELAGDEKKRGQYLRPRFSPGYGDFPLRYQQEIFAVLQLPKTIGITLTESLMMVPTKSVTALMGVSETDTGCQSQGCEICKKTDCPFRR